VKGGAVLGGTRLLAPNSAEPGRPAGVVIRADDVELVAERPQDDEPHYAIEGQITDQIYLGSRRRYEIQTPEGRLL